MLRQDARQSNRRLYIGDIVAVAVADSLFFVSDSIEATTDVSRPYFFEELRVANALDCVERAPTAVFIQSFMMFCYGCITVLQILQYRHRERERS